MVYLIDNLNASSFFLNKGSTMYVSTSIRPNSPAQVSLNSDEKQKSFIKNTFWKVNRAFHYCIVASEIKISMFPAMLLSTSVCMGV